MKSALLVGIAAVVALAVAGVFAANRFARMKRRRRRKAGKRMFDDLL